MSKVTNAERLGLSLLVALVAALVAWAVFADYKADQAPLPRVDTLLNDTTLKHDSVKTGHRRANKKSKKRGKVKKAFTPREINDEMVSSEEN